MEARKRGLVLRDTKKDKENEEEKRKNLLRKINSIFDIFQIK